MHSRTCLFILSSEVIMILENLIEVSARSCIASQTSGSNIVTEVGCLANNDAQTSEYTSMSGDVTLPSGVFQNAPPTVSVVVIQLSQSAINTLTPNSNILSSATLIDVNFPVSGLEGDDRITVIFQVHTIQYVYVVCACFSCIHIYTLYIISMCVCNVYMLIARTYVSIYTTYM